LTFRSAVVRRTSVGLVVAVVLLALGFVGGETGVGHGSPVDGTAASRFGLYPGYAGVTELHHLESWVGHPANYVVQFADIHESAFTSSVWGEVTRAGAFQTMAERITLVESVPLAFGDFLQSGAAGQATARANLQATVSGAHDAEYRVAANYLRNGGYPDAIIRLGWEFDGDWMPWSAPGNEELWITAYRHVADIFRSVSSSFRFDWNGSAGYFAHATAAYPGDNYVDIVGLDVYDKGLGTVWDSSTQSWLDPVAAFATLRDDLTAQRNFAIAHGKPVSYPEWALTGVDGKVNSGVGGDNPTFIQGMSDWINALPANGPGSLSYESYFNEDTEDGHHRIDANYFPNSAARYKFLFGQAPRIASISLTVGSGTVGGQPTVLESRALTPDGALTGLDGTVKFFDGWTNIGQADLDGGVATLKTDPLVAGKHWMWAYYQAAKGAKLTVSPLRVRDVDPAQSTVQAPSVSVTSGDDIELGASVTVRAPGTSSPPGSVVFTNASSGARFRAPLAAGVARLTLPSLPVGVHSFTAKYPASDYHGSATDTLTVTVRPPA
jgi:hypothetical protein